MIYFDFAFSCDVRRPQAPRRNFVGANYTEIMHILASVEWQNEFWGNLLPGAHPVELFWNRFIRIIEFCIESHVPWMSDRDRTFRWPQYIKDLQSRRIRAWKDWTRDFDPLAEISFKRLTSNVSNAEINYIKKFETQILLSGNSRKFFRYVNARTKFKPTIPALIATDGSSCVSDRDKARALSHHFGSVFTHENGVVPHILPTKNSATLSTVKFNPEKVYTITNRE